MEPSDSWIKYSELDLSDPKFNVYSIDTRDFHAGYRFEEKPFKDLATLLKYKKQFFHTEQEVKDTINRYYTDRTPDAYMFMIEAIPNWNLKYIRIWKTEHGFLICDRNNYALRKDILDTKVVND